MQLPPLSLYVHMPWCVQKCPYCDFNSYAAHKDGIPSKEYIQALLDDLDKDLMTYSLTDKKRVLTSIFIGGGTPSLFKASEIAQLIYGIAKRCRFARDIEITMEVNPGTIKPENFIEYRRAGITRLSLGVQSFADDKLIALGRIHSSSEALDAICAIKEAGFSSFNVDLMHGLPEQDLNAALSDLKIATKLNVPHLSWYQLTIEPQTAFYNATPILPEDNTLWDIYQQGQEFLAEQGYTRYEISGYSQPNKECQHNLNYWRFGDYLGIGCGAHGKITSLDTGQIIRTEKMGAPKTYLAPNKEFLKQSRVITKKELPFEFFVNRFRLEETCPKLEFTLFTGLDVSEIDEQILECVNKNLLENKDLYWKVTEKGRLFLNDLLEVFL